MGFLSDAWGKAKKDPIGTLMSGGLNTLGPDVPEPPPPPSVEAEPVVRMPTQDDAKKAKRLNVLAQNRRRGRASTMLTDNADAMGG